MTGTFVECTGFVWFRLNGASGENLLAKHLNHRAFREEVLCTLVHDERIEEHLRGNVYTTRRLKEPKLVYYKAYLDRDLAIERENQLKRFSSAYVALLKRLKLRI